jgi:hypothetical protein
MPETNQDHLIEKLELISNDLREEIQKVNKAFEVTEPLANHLGYTLCRKTGNLIKV